MAAHAELAMAYSRCDNHVTVHTVNLNIHKIMSEPEGGQVDRTIANRATGASLCLKWRSIPTIHCVLIIRNQIAQGNVAESVDTLIELNILSLGVVDRPINLFNGPRLQCPNCILEHAGWDFVATVSHFLLVDHVNEIPQWAADTRNVCERALDGTIKCGTEWIVPCLEVIPDVGEIRQEGKFVVREIDVCRLHDLEIDDICTKSKKLKEKTMSR
jgi:hypothetical protein